jgi:hypothetical protein
MHLELISEIIYVTNSLIEITKKGKINSEKDAAIGLFWRKRSYLYLEIIPCRCCKLEIAK